MHNFDQTLMKDSLIPDTSDRSTESESPSPESPSKRKTNLQLEKMRLGIQGSLFSKGKCSSLSDFRKNSSPIPTSEDTSARQSPENRSPRKLDATRKASYSHSAKERSSIRFLSPTKTAPHKLSASSQDEFNLMEYPLEGSARLTSGDSIADENFFEAFEKNEENALKLCFDPMDEGEKGSKKVNILAEKSVVDEEDDGELSEEETDYLGRKHSVFLVDKDKEIEDLKKELHVTEDSNIYFIQGNFMDYYTEEEILGEGASGVVKKCVKNGTQEYYAVKGVHYRNDDEILVLIIKEFQNHSKLNHKNIIKVYELYIDYFSRKIYTVMELAECDELFESIKNLGHYSEVVASGIFKQILTGINYLHLNGVCHRDIKPNNILVSKDGKVVKITDFNVSKFLDKKSHQYSPLSTTNYKMWTHTGTIAFTAPEVFEGIEYTEAIDMWSAGTVLYTMLCGYQPFQSEYVQDLMELIKSAKYEFHPESWSTISAEAKQLIRWCLDPNCKTRCSPSQALMCPWITSRGMIPDVKIPMKKNHQRIKSIFETRPRGDSSSKAALQVYTTPLEKNQSDFAKRRSSALDCFDFQNYRAKNPTKTPKKPLKILSTFGEVLPESNPQEEEASPQLKKAKSNITERRLMQMRNLMEAIEEPLSLDLEENAEVKKTNKFIKKAKKNMYDDINQDAMETNEVKFGLTDTNCQETMN